MGYQMPSPGDIAPHAASSHIGRMHRAHAGTGLFEHETR
jgi:hypothetical protein